MPEIERLKPIVAKGVFEQMKRERIRGDKQLLKETHQKRCVEMVRGIFENMEVVLIPRS